MDNYLLDDIDLLEAIEFDLLMQEEDVITEASMYGMKINKENLEDEKFVKELVKKIREDEHILTKNIALTLFIIGAISSLTVVGLPIGILLLVIASKIKSPYELTEKDLKKLDNCFEKTINKLKNKLDKTKEESKKKELSDLIDKLENNRERIYERKAKAEIDARIDKVVNFSKYGKFGIKVGGTEIICDYEDTISDIVKGKYKSEEEIKASFKATKLPFNRIEQFYANGIKSHNDFIKLVKEKGKAANGISFMGGKGYEDSYGKTVIKCLKDKQIVDILSDVHDTTILYSYDDDCCYDWIAEEDNNITKLSVNEFLQASKSVYEDYIKVFKEFNK